MRVGLPVGWLREAADLGIDRRTENSQRRVEPWKCKHIDVSYTWLGIEKATALAKALTPPGSATLQLETFNASWSSIGVEGATALLEVLQDAPSLTVVDLSGNWIRECLL